MEVWGILIQAGGSFAISAAMVAYVLGHRPRSSLHRLLLTVLVAIMAWNAGLLIRHGSGGGSLAVVGFRVEFAGVFALPPLFLCLAAWSARISVAEERLRSVLAAVLVPSGLAYLALLTNAGHRLFSIVPLREAARMGSTEWAGPFFWAATVWSYLCIQAGIVLCLATGWRSRDPLERSRLLLMAAGAAVPLLTNFAFVMHWIPRTITPAALALTGLLLVLSAARYRFLEFGPLPAREVINELRDGLVLTDAEDRIAEANPAAEVLLDCSAGELRGHSVFQVADTLDESGELAASLLACTAEKTAALDVETPSGRAIEVRAGWLGGRSDKPAGRFLVLGDRTEQLRSERLRDRAMRLRSVGSLAAGVAHEINNPLSYVRANLGQLHALADTVDACLPQIHAKQAEELADMRELIEECIEGAARISDIVESTRSLSHCDEEAREEIDLNEIVRGAIQFAALDERPGLEVEQALETGLPCATGSTTRLGQVALNLLINARQALDARPRGRIRVETCRRNGELQLCVHDDGPGVPGELRERIFDPFFTTKSPEDGTGLGLAVAFDITSEHGGSLEVDRSPLGGACFTLRIPLGAAA